MSELLPLPESPFLALSSCDDQRPDWTRFYQPHDVLMLGSPKVWSSSSYHRDAKIGGDLFVASERDGDKPPRMVMKRSIVIPFMKAMYAYRGTKPNDPSLKIGLLVFIDEIVGDSEAHTA